MDTTSYLQFFREHFQDLVPINIHVTDSHMKTSFKGCYFRPEFVYFIPVFWQQLNQFKTSLKQVMDTQYIISFDVNKQLMIMVQKTHKVKEGACPYLQRRLVNVTEPDKWSHNTKLISMYTGDLNTGQISVQISTSDLLVK